MSETNQSGDLSNWADQMKALAQVGDNLIAKWRPDGATGAETQDMNKLALSILASGYLCRVYTDSFRPVFMPLWNYAINQGGPDPDYVYSTAEIDATGRLRDIRIPRYKPLRGDHPAEFRHDAPLGHGAGQPGPRRQRPGRSSSRPGRPLQSCVERRTADRLRR